MSIGHDQMVRDGHYAEDGSFDQHNAVLWHAAGCEQWPCLSVYKIPCGNNVLLLKVAHLKLFPRYWLSRAIKSS